MYLRFWIFTSGTELNILVHLYSLIIWSLRSKFCKLFEPVRTEHISYVKLKRASSWSRWSGANGKRWRDLMLGCRAGVQKVSILSTRILDNHGLVRQSGSQTTSNKGYLVRQIRFVIKQYRSELSNQTKKFPTAKLAQLYKINGKKCI